MIAHPASPADLPRDRWRDACGTATLLSFLLVVIHVVSPAVFGLPVPYAGGAAVVLLVGATACLGLRTLQARLAATVALIGLIGLRALSGVRPDLLLTEHGALSLPDGLALVLLALAERTMLAAAPTRTA